MDFSLDFISNAWFCVRTIHDRLAASQRQKNDNVKGKDFVCFVRASCDPHLDRDLICKCRACSVSAWGSWDSQIYHIELWSPAGIIRWVYNQMYSQMSFQTSSPSATRRKHCTVNHHYLQIIFWCLASVYCCSVQSLGIRVWVCTSTFWSAWTVDARSCLSLGRLCCLDSDIPCRRCHLRLTWSSWCPFALRTVGEAGGEKTSENVVICNRTIVSMQRQNMCFLSPGLTKVLTCGRPPTSPATTSSSASRSEAARTFWSSCCCSSLVENIKSPSSIPANFVITYQRQSHKDKKTDT